MNFFDYFQIAALAILFVGIVWKAVYLRRTSGINAIVVGRGKRGWGLVFELYAFAALALWMLEMLLTALPTGIHIMPLPTDVQLFDSLPAKIIGTTSILFGLSIFIWAYISFGRSWRVGFDRTAPGELVTTGIFAFSRNPIYLFLDLWFVGVFLINGRLSFLIFALLAIVHVHIQILREEKFLSDLYGEEYQNYRSQTGRYLVF